MKTPLSSKLIGATIYSQNGAFVTVSKIARIITDEKTEKILPYAVDKRGIGGHLGACNSDESAARLIQSKMQKPNQSKTQVRLVFE